MRYILGVIAVIFVALIAILLVTRDGGDEQTGRQQIVLSEEAREGTSVALTIQGELVGQNERQAIRVKISQNERRVEILDGYEEAVDRAHTFANTPAAYENFLIALEKLGFTREKDSAANDDERGVCPTGKTYIYELKEFSQQRLHLWNSSCSSKSGTLGGKGSTIRRLFKAQIPDYKKLVKGVNL